MFWPDCTGAIVVMFDYQLIFHYESTQDETVKMYSRQFMMIKAGVPDGAILNTFLAEGIEDEEAKEIIEKLKEIKGV